MIQHHQELEYRGPTRLSQISVTFKHYPSAFSRYSLLRLIKECWVHRREWLSYPVLFGMFIPLACFDICLAVYHRITFALLKIPYIPRSRYIRIDRHHLPYLSWSQKFACAYCGYANGLLQYAVQIAGKTEAFFCPIKHRRTTEFLPPPHHQQFAEFGDSRGYQQRIHNFRNTETPSFKNVLTKSEPKPSQMK